MNNKTRETIATEALTALDQSRQIEAFTKRFPQFDVAEAYAVASSIRHKRQTRGEKQIGRKIGFTNRSIWDEYNINAPVWGDMYDHSVRPLNSEQPVSLAPFCEPQIEPEIVFRLSGVPQEDMDEYALFECVELVGHGFEIVQSIFPGWAFKVPDTIAGFGMHGTLLLGPTLRVTLQNRDSLFASLPNFKVTLSCDGKPVDHGQGSNVLGGPLTALRHLIGLLARDPHNPPLRAGEIITTGTITRAFRVKNGENWTTAISGIDLPDLALRFG